MNRAVIEIRHVQIAAAVEGETARPGQPGAGEHAEVSVSWAELANRFVANTGDKKVFALAPWLPARPMRRR